MANKPTTENIGGRRRVQLREAAAGDSNFIFDVHRQAFREYVELGGGWDDRHEAGACVLYRGGLCGRGPVRYSFQLAAASVILMPSKKIDFNVVRVIALALPDVEASTIHGAPSLKVRGKLWAQRDELSLVGGYHCLVGPHCSASTSRLTPLRSE